MTTYETDYEALADFAQELKLTALEAIDLKEQVEGTNEKEMSESLFEKLYEYYAFTICEMPYGTAKARDGDPCEWISERLFMDFVTKVN